jgi:hypothetical protein
VNDPYLFALDRYDSSLAQLAETCRYRLAIHAQMFGYVLVRDAPNALIVRPLKKQLGDPWNEMSERSGIQVQKRVNEAGAH